MPSAASDRFDAKARRLCPDGACIGLLGENNICKVCGKSAQGGGQAPAAQDRDAGSDDAGDESAGDGPDDSVGAAGEADASADSDAATGGFDAKRALCPDGACVGVIGSNGKCTVCGR